MKMYLLVFTGMTMAFLAESCQGNQTTNNAWKRETRLLEKEVISDSFFFSWHILIHLPLWCYNIYHLMLKFQSHIHEIVNLQEMIN